MRKLLSLLIASAALAPAFAADLLTSIEDRGRSETFLAMLEQSGLREEIEQADGPLTLIVPTDKAFVGVSPETVARLFSPSQRDTLRQILLHHAVRGEGGGASLAVAGSVRTLAGTQLSFAVRGGKLQVNDVPFAAVDLATDGGGYHEIDSILLPDPSVLEPTAARRIAARALRFSAQADLGAAGQVAVLETAFAAVLELDRQAELPRQLMTQAFDDPGARADALRDALLNLFDEASRASFAMTSQETKDDSTPLVRFDGSDADPGWFTLNDDVMGGISNSRIQIKEAEGESDGRAVFTGALSMENNGGFASIRSQAKDYDLTGYKGLRLRVRTDGREYGVSALAGDERGRVGSWRKRFQVSADEWATVDVPFADMVLNVRGRQYPEVGPPDLAAVRSFSFIIADKDETPFRMEIESIGAYR